VEPVALVVPDTQNGLVAMARTARTVGSGSVTGCTSTGADYSRAKQLSPFAILQNGLRMGSRALGRHGAAMTKTWEQAVHVALFTAAVATIVALMVWLRFK
jgi:hypothetical protein